MCLCVFWLVHIFVRVSPIVLWPWAVLRQVPLQLTSSTILNSTSWFCNPPARSQSSLFRPSVSVSSCQLPAWPYTAYEKQHFSAVILTIGGTPVQVKTLNVCAGLEVTTDAHALASRGLCSLDGVESNACMHVFMCVCAHLCLAICWLRCVAMSFQPIYLLPPLSFTALFITLLAYCLTYRVPPARIPVRLAAFEHGLLPLAHLFAIYFYCVHTLRLAATHIQAHAWENCQYNFERLSTQSACLLRLFIWLRGWHIYIQTYTCMLAEFVMSHRVEYNVTIIKIF